MRNIDLSPLYRSFIGFDHLASMIDSASRNEKQSSYPPYNIELIAEDKYRITMAVAGFAEHEVSIEVQENTLKVTGNKTGSDEERKFLHKGISERNFERKFQLGDHVNVLEAKMENGLLHVNLERVVPEAKKPRTIQISKGTEKLIEDAHKPS
ncbi:Hsp20 family protein [Paraglaciecola polaris]|uniref:Molecular chaperone IbpA n=3 Tax=Paraglaciecola polaris TaxID=222814 RepID=K6ZS48_9ALTE|nr:Hsp20 family protein [Paraglaciecola polaris]GAC31658.1 molecular chaperone IbpA [Paraglaciecola polaris LMG 21857]